MNYRPSNTSSPATFCGAKRCKAAAQDSQNQLNEFPSEDSPRKCSAVSYVNQANQFAKFENIDSEPKVIVNAAHQRTPNTGSQSNLDSFQQKGIINSYLHTPKNSQNNLENLGNSYFQKRSGQFRTTHMENETINRQGFTATDRIKMTESTILNTLRSVRTPIVNYQEARGVPRTESISFISLITSLCTHAYTAAITILVMLWNLAPLLDGFVYFARFIIDKLIDIFETRDQKEKIMKTAVFAGEVIIIFFLIFLIVGLIFMPVYVLTARIMNKIWGMIKW